MAFDRVKRFESPSIAVRAATQGSFPENLTRTVAQGTKERR